MKDQELDKILRQIANDAAIDDQAANEIADSPSLWWSVQRDIRNIAPAKAPWPPKVIRRLLMIGAPVAIALLIGIFLYTIKTPVQETAMDQGPVSQQNPDRASQNAAQPIAGPESAPVSVSANPNTVSAAKTVKAVHKTHSAQLPRTLVAQGTNKAATEIKSDFIALAYARSPDSGQLVRVKVPSSMMVSLGVVPTVSDPSKLIDAEVLVGDDGLTHAIRFIRQ
jgi:hypothetical protein